MIAVPILNAMEKEICWIFSIFNEAQNSYLWQNLELLQHHRQSILVVDGGSSDTTVSMLTEKTISALALPGSTRGQRFDLGLREATADAVIFVHPRTLLTEAVIMKAQELPATHVWGAFTHSFDQAHPLLRFTSWWSNRVRGDLRGIFYLDHVLWARRSLLVEVGGFPHAAIFEDTLLSKRLLRRGRPLRLQETTVTSALRFEKNGLARQIFLNQLAKLRFYLRMDPTEINQTYERGLGLNGAVTSQGQHAPAAAAPPADRS
jgi:hypothetical protein